MKPTYEVLAIYPNPVRFSDGRVFIAFLEIASGLRSELDAMDIRDEHSVSMPGFILYAGLRK